MNLILFAAQLLAALLDLAAAIVELVLIYSREASRPRASRPRMGRVSRDTREAK